MTRTHLIVGWCGAAMLAGLLAGPASGALVLVEAGVSRAPIVVFENAPPRTRAAADELAEYIEKTSGVRPEVIEGRPDPMPAHAIWVGFQPVLGELFPELDFEFEHPEEILISANENHLVIAGRDRWDPENMVVKGRWSRPIEGWQQEYGTANAVYTFLQDRLDVRWLWPGEDGIDVIRRETIAFEPFVYRYHPRIRMRHAVFLWSRPTDPRGSISVDWVRHQRILLDSSNAMYRISLHSPHYHPGAQFLETHPEFFALQPDGTRSGYPPGRSKLCVSNPAVHDRWMADVAEQLAEDPVRTIFAAGIPDTARVGLCVCENCRAWDSLDAPRRLLLWEGLSQDYVAMSDRYVRYANTLARRLRERYPDREYYVAMLAYGPALPAPRETVPDDNVLVFHCGNWFLDIRHQDRTSYDGETVAGQFADWAAIGTKNMVFRPNVSSRAGLWNGHPDVPFGRVMETLDHVFENNAMGIYLASLYDFWPTQGPLYYLLAQRAWNPDLDGREVLDDYYRRGFGPAHEQLKAYWTLMEESSVRMADGDLPFHEVYDAAFFHRAAGVLDEAEDRLAGAADIFLRRVAHVRVGLDYHRLLVGAREGMDRYRASAGRDTEAAEQVRENWRRIEALVAGEATFNNALLSALKNRLHPDAQ